MADNNRILAGLALAGIPILHYWAYSKGYTPEYMNQLTDALCDIPNMILGTNLTTLHADKVGLYAGIPTGLAAIISGLAGKEPKNNK